jgi:glycosyltransferase involved in cell wall biosynthesis
MDFNHTFLRERYIVVKDRYLHNNLDIFSKLKQFSPDVVITDGFYPTQLYAFGYAAMKGVAHIPMTDGTIISEQALSSVHRMIRRIVYARSHAFVSASIGGAKLYESYGIPVERCFQSCLCIDNSAFMPTLQSEQKQYDFIFCGRIEQGKSPLFALHVALEVAKKLRRTVKILFVGSGSEEERIRNAAALQPDLVQAEFHGFAAQKELPSLYQSARIFLFPTLADVWGVVANEACASGLPVIVSPHAGVVGELILDGQNGFVCELDVNLWAERAIQLLTQEDLYRSFSRRSLSLVSQYTFDTAAEGFMNACETALSIRAPKASSVKG